MEEGDIDVNKGSANAHNLSNDVVAVTFEQFVIEATLQSRSKEHDTIVMLQVCQTSQVQQIVEAPLGVLYNFTHSEVTIVIRLRKCYSCSTDNSDSGKIHAHRWAHEEVNQTVLVLNMDVSKQPTT
mmetsp:Transcript_10207/g.33609  ORF Transcript_10207/g.33609 Transcript_10207/m.33609 type:complete len:126 (+) Transcript_10207:2741-3118(+)